MRIINKVLGWIFIIGVILLFVTLVDQIWFRWELQKMLFTSLGFIVGSVFVAFLINAGDGEQ